MGLGSRATSQYPGQVWDGSTPTRLDPNGDNLDIWRNPDAGDYSQLAAEIVGIQTQLETGYQYPVNYAFDKSGAVSVANDISPWRVITKASKLISWYAVAKTAPVGAILKADLKVSTDNGATFATLWGTTTANKPQIADGLKAGSGTAFDTLTLAAGTIVRLDVLQIGSGTAGSDLSVVLVTRAVK